MGRHPDLRSTSETSRDGHPWGAPQDISFQHHNGGGSSGISGMFSTGGIRWWLRSALLMAPPQPTAVASPPRPPMCGVRPHGGRSCHTAAAPIARYTARVSRRGERSGLAPRGHHDHERPFATGELAPASQCDPRRRHPMSPDQTRSHP